jgi:hypothetical protein
MKNLALIVEDVISILAPKVLSRSISKKYLSQNLFAQTSDYAIRSDRHLLDIKSIRKARVLFIKSEFLETSLEVLGKKNDAKVILVGDSDIDWMKPIENLPIGLRRIYLQNYLHPNDERHRVLPIGIEGRNWGRNGLPHLYGDFYRQRKKQDRVLIGPYGLTHSERSELLSLKEDFAPEIQLCTNRIPSLRYAFLASSFRFLACPRGNGQDTHRFWEVLYRGSIPIVRKSQWSQNLKSQIGNCFIEVDDWSGESLTISNVYAQVSEASFNPTATGIYWPDWRNKLHTLAR